MREVTLREAREIARVEEEHQAITNKYEKKRREGSWSIKKDIDSLVSLLVIIILRTITSSLNHFLLSF